MKIGIQEISFRRYGGNYFKKIREYGYTAADYDMCNTEAELYKLNEDKRKEFLQSVRKMANEAGVEIYQTHGPWRWPVRDYTEEDRAERMEKMKTSIRACSYMGCKNWVIHPIMPMGVADLGTPDEQKTWDINKAFMSELLKVAKEYDVTICFENMPMPKLGIATPEETLRFVEEISDENLKICFDTGHAAIFSEQISVGDAIRKMGDKIACFHVHDNNGWADIHLMPMTGVINWEDVCAAIKEIGYKGVFSLETSAATTLPEDLHVRLNQIFFEVAESLVKKIEN